MSDKKPYWFHVTVPHSGTRFVNNTFERSGYSVNSVLPWEQRQKRDVSLGWAHYMTFKAPIRPMLLECLDEADCKWMTVRDPIMTMKTHWASTEDEPWMPQRQLHTDMRLDRLEEVYKIQVENAFDLFDGRAYRVDKDDISLLAEWTGAPLKTPGDRESHHAGTRMAEAVDARNVDMIEQLTAGTDWWPRWRDEITPIFKDLYEDLGYDIWWT